MTRLNFLKGKALNMDEEPRLSLPAQETSSASIDLTTAVHRVHKTRNRTKLLNYANN